MTLLWVGALLVSFWILTKGADFVVDSAQKIGAHLGLTTFGAGAIIIGSLTSLPDLVAGLTAQIRGVSDIVTGTAVGANIADILLIVALIALISKGVQVVSDDLHFDLAWFVTATGALVWVMHDGVVRGVESFILLLMFGVYVLSTYAVARERLGHTPVDGRTLFTKRDVFNLVLGFVFLVVGAQIAVDAAIALSGIFNIATGVVGLFALALGTTLPEFFVTIQSVRKNKASLALGNIFGSNVFNALVVVGLPGMLGAIHPDAVTASIGVWVMVASTAIFAGAVLIRKRISLFEGAFYLIAYLIFMLVVAGVIG